MLKRILSVSLALIFISTTVLAQINVDVLDAANDIISIASSGTVGKTVSVMILNPGFTKEDAIMGSDGATQYFNSFVPSSATYSIPVKIMGSAGGEFNVYLKSSGTEKTASFTFYNVRYKQKCIDDINAASSGEDITPYFEELIKAYGKSDNTSYIILGSKAVADAFLLLRDAMPDKRIPSDADAVNELVNKSIVLASYNTKNTSLCFSGNNILNPDVIGISSSAELMDYNSNISQDGKTYIKQKLLSTTYKKPEEIANKFKTLVHRGVLINYKELGYGHIHSYLSAKYRSVYEGAGFVIPASENSSKYSNLLTLTDETLEAMAAKFNAFTASSEGTTSNPVINTTPGNTGSVGGSFSTGGGISYVDPSPQPVNPPVQPQFSFNDVSQDHWAANSIDFLKSKGWINGYEDGSFRPDDHITRAEYAKLILNVFGIKEGGEAKFSDAPNDAWYAPFVAAAQANGIINGTDGNFFPERKLTRQDAAVIICRILGETSSADVNFADADLISDYALYSISYLANLGVINGYGDNTFKPDGNITRAEISKIICTLSEKGGIK